MLVIVRFVKYEKGVKNQLPNASEIIKREKSGKVSLVAMLDCVSLCTAATTAGHVRRTSACHPQYTSVC